jgi:hypothetical protein
VNFQATSSEQGARFELLCDEALSAAGWTLHGKHVVSSVGVEIDQVAEKGGTVVLIEYKGSERGNRPGLLRTDTMKKAICNGALIRDLKEDLKYWVVTSHLPMRGSSKNMMDRALACGYVDRFMDYEQLVAEEKGWAD